MGRLIAEDWYNLTPDVTASMAISRMKRAFVDVAPDLARYYAAAGPMWRNHVPAAGGQGYGGPCSGLPAEVGSGYGGPRFGAIASGGPGYGVSGYGGPGYGGPGYGGPGYCHPGGEWREEVKRVLLCRLLFVFLLYFYFYYLYLTFRPLVCYF